MHITLTCIVSQRTLQAHMHWLAMYAYLYMCYINLCKDCNMHVVAVTCISCNISEEYEQNLL